MNGKITATLILLSCLCSMSAQTQLQRSVLSNGAVNARGASGGMRGTLSQSAIGISKSSTILSEGFWYRAPKAVTTIVIPSSEGDIGTTVTIPIVLASSRNLLVNGPRQVIVNIRYNRTVLVHKGNFPVRFDGDDAIITIAATVRDTVGIIAEMPFLVALGNTEKSPLTIESVKWPGNELIQSTLTNGEFTVLGVCKEGNTVRLIRRGTGTGIVNVSPMPVSSSADVVFSAGEAGHYRVILVDGMGRVVSELANSEFAAGRHTIALQSSEIPSGSYHVVLLSQKATHSRAIMIEK